MTDSKADLHLASVCHAGTEQSRLSKAKALRIDQNQCRRLKDYYGFEHPKWAASAEQAFVHYPSAGQRAEERL
jgi:hypothetical protein